MNFLKEDLYSGTDSESLISVQGKTTYRLSKNAENEKYYVVYAEEDDIYATEELDRYAFHDQYETKEYAIYLPRDKRASSIKRIVDYYAKIDEWNIALRGKKNAKDLLKKLERIVNHGFYAILRHEKIIECYINIGKGILLNIDKPLFTNTSEVIYSIIYKKKVLRVNHSDIDILVDKIILLQKKMKFIS